MKDEINEMRGEERREEKREEIREKNRVAATIRTRRQSLEL